MGAPKAKSLGQYQLVRKLGTGGMAEVFLAAQRMDGGVTRPVVIKAILPHLAEDERFVDMFMREARVAAMLSHPNIVHIHDVTKLEDRPCLVMEFLKGRDLWTVMQRFQGREEAAPPHHAAAVIAQAASGLDYAHRKRDRAGQSLDLVHRDISPHNLFLTREGQVRVLDFGIAKSAYQTQRTESGIIKGKLPYMAPEQARGKDVDHRADLFALGVVLWEMVTGKRLFARDDPLQTMTAMFSEATPEPSSVRPVPDVLERIIMRCLARSPTDRFDSCESLAVAIRAWLASESADTENRLVKRLLNSAVPVGEDEAFYEPEVGTSELGDEDLSLVTNELTPSHSGVSSKSLLDKGPPPPPPDITPPPPQNLPAASKPLPIWKIVGAGVALLCVAFGITAAALSKDEPPPLTPPPMVSLPPQIETPTEVPPAEVVVRFESIPAGVVVQVDGVALEPTSAGSAQLTVAPSDEVRHVRALHGERELWRYDGIFREAIVVELPPLSVPETTEAAPEVSNAEPEITEPEPTMRVRRTTMRVRGPIMVIRRDPPSMTRMTSMMTVRMTSTMLGMQIDLGYP